MTKDRALQIRRVLETAVQSLNNDEALMVKTLYPRWVAGKAYAAGCMVRWNGNLWKALQAHTAMAGWEPGNAASLWAQINEIHDGTMDDPIPYEGNMALEDGKYYMQNYTIYKCTRGTVNPVYTALSELVGIYVEVVT